MPAILVLGGRGWGDMVRSRSFGITGAYLALP